MEILKLMEIDLVKHSETWMAKLMLMEIDLVKHSETWMAKLMRKEIARDLMTDC